jgi:cytochrome c-type biogenesis protein CcmH/NrfG
VGDSSGVDACEILRRRARRHARKGEHRKAALALRELCAREGDAASWTLLGDMWRRARRLDDALAALEQALWLHKRAGADRRAQTVSRLIDQLAVA